MNSKNFTWAIDEERLVQDIQEFQFAGVLKQLSPCVNSMQENTDYYLLVLDLPERVSMQDVQVSLLDKSITICFNERTPIPNALGEYNYYSNCFFREVLVPENGIASLLTFQISDSVLLLKIPKIQGVGLVGRLRFFWQWIRWKVEYQL